ncbi:Puromycin-sensitive aminopeptidase, partial [Taenia solium]
IGKIKPPTTSLSEEVRAPQSKRLIVHDWWMDLWGRCVATHFVSSDYTPVLQLDGLKSSHPIEVEVNSAQKVEEIFDAVSYQKGSCLIHMLYNRIGHCPFQDGMKAYFEKFKYSNATTEDLWTVLQATSGCDVTEFMPLWTKQTGYPVVSVRLIRAPDGKCSVGLKQQRFLIDGSPTNGEQPQHWCIPIIVRAVDDSERLLLHKVVDIPSSASNPREVICSLSHPVSSHGIRLKPNAVGFYRVLYEPAIMNTIIEAISSGTVPERDRITLLDDQFALARAGFLRLDEVLQFCRAFAKETRHSVWSVLSDGLAQVRTLLEEATYPVGDKVVFPEASKAICGLNKLCNELALPVYEKIGFEPTSTDSNKDRLLRPNIISTLGRIGHADVICRAQTAFRRHYAAVVSAPGDEDAANQSERISPDLRAAIYSICTRNGGVEEFGKLVEMFGGVGRVEGGFPVGSSKVDVFHLGWLDGKADWDVRRVKSWDGMVNAKRM